MPTVNIRAPKGFEVSVSKGEDGSLSVRTWQATETAAGVSSVTHAQIAERFAELRREKDTLNARHHKESESLVELCAGLGHQFGEPRHIVEISAHAPKREGLKHECCACGFWDWVDGNAQPHRAAPEPGSSFFSAILEAVREAVSAPDSALRQDLASTFPLPQQAHTVDPCVRDTLEAVPPAPDQQGRHSR